MKPYLSIVAASRNDNHGGDLHRRMQVFVTALLEQCRRHQVDSELILVEWNPPADRPKLAQALEWPKEAGPCQVRIIEVPPELHRRYRHSDRLPLFQMIAKNVGIRRARGDFVLATNIDILFSDELMQFIASRGLRRDRMYRIDRWDVTADVPDGRPVAEQLEFCKTHVLRISERFGTRNMATGRVSNVHWRLSRREKLVEAFQERFCPQRLKLPVALHTNACGDFTMMAAERWASVRAYPEFELYSMHIDGLLCWMAHHDGTLEEVLPDPMRTYHIEHASGSGFTPEGVNSLYGRLDAAGIGRLDWPAVRDWALHMRRTRKPIIFCNSDWGLADENLPETLVPIPPVKP